MTVPFGFSVGDFVAALKLFKDVGDALKEHGGASDQYQQVVRELESINAVLLHIQSLKPSADNLKYINAIKGQAQLSQNTITGFLDRLAKYDNALGKSTKTGFHHGTFSKAKWATYISKEVDKLREIVQSQSISLRMLFDIGSLEYLSRLEHDQVDTQKWMASTSLRTQTQFTNVCQSMHKMESSVDQATRDVQASFLAHHNETRSHLAHVQHTMLNQMSIANLSLTDNINSVNDRIAQLNANLPSMLSSTIQQVLMMPRVPKNITTSNTMMYLGGATEQMSCLQQPSVPNHFILPNRIIPGQISMTQALTLLSKLITLSFSIALGILLHELYRFFLTVLFLFPQLASYLRVLRSIPRSVSLYLQDNINFEDVLGRLHSLQFEQFRHWRVFESLLVCTFEDVPGRDKVLKGHYRLVNAKNQGRVLNASNWSQSVLPNTRIVMFVQVVAIDSELGRCPRCSSTVEKLNEEQSRCGGCELIYSCSPVPKTEPGASMRPRESINKPQRANLNINESQRHGHLGEPRKNSDSEQSKPKNRSSPSAGHQRHPFPKDKSSQERKRQNIEQSKRRMQARLQGRVEGRVEAAERGQKIQAKSQATSLEKQELRFFRRIYGVAVRSRRSRDVRIHQGDSNSKIAKISDLSPKWRPEDWVLEHSSRRHIVRSYPYFARDERSQELKFNFYRKARVRIL